MNIFNNIPKNSKVEDFIDLFSNEKIKIQRIVSPVGCELSKEWYDQNQDEAILLIQGCATIKFENSEHNLTSGDFLSIPAHKKHLVSSVSDTEDTIWVTIFS